ncbi:MAG: transketolase C-terminal domain-containing protein [Syntrophales bacterium]|nr:transketolase C-terminal domain-containing protein [Syntrophales bacterium]
MEKKKDLLVREKLLEAFRLMCRIRFFEERAKALYKKGLLYCSFLGALHTYKPIDVKMIKNCARETGAIITVEEHNLSGGMGSAVAEVRADSNVSGIKFKRIAFPDIYVSLVGSQEWLRGKYGISPEKIAVTV